MSQLNVKLFCITNFKNGIMLENGFFVDGYLAEPGIKLNKANPPRVWLSEEAANADLKFMREKQENDNANYDGPAIGMSYEFLDPKTRVVEFVGEIEWQSDES